MWIALLLMSLVAMANRVHVEACVGVCCETAAPVEPDEESCCCCSGERPDAPTDALHGRCVPGCCVAFDVSIELAPADPVADGDTPSARLPHAHRATSDVVHHGNAPRRRCNRGPPRVAATVALRATIQLLI